MPGVDSTRLVTGGDAIADSIEAYVLLMEQRFTEAAGTEQEQLLDRFREDARRHPRWAGIAGDLDQWEDEDGNLVVGVSPVSDAYDRAVRAEYGDADNPPVPLLRMGMLSHAVDIGQSLTAQFRGPGVE